MTWQVIKQPDGKLGVFSSNENDWILTDCTPDEVEELFAGDMGRDTVRRLRDVRRKIDLVLAGEAEKAYPVTSMSYEEAIALANHRAECEDEDSEEET